MTIYGYIRVSRDDQNTGRQEDALQAVADEVVIEHGSAVKERPLFDQLMAKIGEGDTLAVLSLDRAFRSAVDAINCVDDLKKRGAHFRMLDLNIDTTQKTGRFIFHIMAGLAEIERENLIERTKEGLEAAKARGVTLGRPRSLTRDQVKHALDQIEQHGKSVTEMAELLNVSRSTLHRAIGSQKALRSLPSKVRKLSVDIGAWAIMRELDLSDASDKLYKALADLPRMKGVDKDSFEESLDYARAMQSEEADWKRGD